MGVKIQLLLEENLIKSIEWQKRISQSLFFAAACIHDSGYLISLRSRSTHARLCNTVSLPFFCVFKPVGLLSAV